jgi:hypothetical protein
LLVGSSAEQRQHEHFFTNDTQLPRIVAIPGTAIRRRTSSHCEASSNPYHARPMMKRATTTVSVLSADANRPLLQLQQRKESERQFEPVTGEHPR